MKWRRCRRTRLENHPAQFAAQLATTANMLGLSEPTIAAMLGHSRGTITSRYVHHVDDVLRAAAVG